LKEKVYAFPRTCPAREAASAATATRKSVFHGSRAAGVKISVRVPAQRKAPARAGVMEKYGASIFAGILPSSTIGSEKTMRISFACSRFAISPVGPALSMVRVGD
jgi:hypothetical protein